MKTPTFFVPVALILALALGACGASAPAAMDYDRGEYSEAPMGAAPQVAMDEMAADSNNSFAGDEASAPNTNAERLVIQNASLAIVVDNPQDSLEAISELAESFGGFVVDSYVYQRTLSNGLQAPSGSITIRVPAERLQEALAIIEDDANTVQTRSVSGQDVTAQYTDLQSRLRNLEGAETLLRQIMEEATDTEDVLVAFNEFNYITEQIEVIKGQIKYYEESAALSSISVELTASLAVQPLTIAGWEPVGVAKDAIQALISALQGIVNIAIWLALYALPILLVLGLPVYFFVRWLRQRRANAAGKTTPAAKAKAKRNKR
ncbi:MAG TPA: DUF4349 domain-containing protein [Anaerolineales bacterium]|nr:DUF4349 domain-containing protein [Anaerolineales bacterium]HRQ92551.1 DUF4349 domain-containing protein [Anaerolineales bacterium]